jgi:hypothetical protein
MTSDVITELSVHRFDLNSYTAIHGNTGPTHRQQGGRPQEPRKHQKASKSRIYGLPSLDTTDMNKAS